MSTVPKADLAVASLAESANLVSYYRKYAERCHTAAQNASNEKQREELQKMVSVWQDFAAEHERTIRTQGPLQRDVNSRPRIPGWM